MLTIVKITLTASRKSKLILLFLSYLSTFCLITSTASASIVIPRFELPTGVAVTAANRSEQNTRVIQANGDDFTRRKENNWLKLFIHIDEAKRNTVNDEFGLMVISHQTGEGSRTGMKYDKGVLHSAKTRYYLKNDEVHLLPFSEKKSPSLNKEQQKGIKYWAQGNTYYQHVIDTVSRRQYNIGQEVKLDKSELEGFDGDSGVVTLLKVERRWEKEIAEFKLSTTFSQFDKQCQYLFWVLADSGRPVHFEVQCRASFAKNDGFQGKNIGYLDETTIREFSYNDLAISTISPTVLPALQPKGSIKGIEFSESLGQLMFLSEEYETNSSWLTFWDLNQRKMLNTVKQPGEILHLSEQGHAAFVLSQSRVHSAMSKIGKRYKPFGQASNFDLKRSLTDSDLLGMYPVTVNEQNEIEVWNLGYNKLIFREPLPSPKHSLVSVAQDGRVLTASTRGEFQLHSMKIDVSGCGASTTQEAYCQRPKVSFENTTTSLKVTLPENNAQLINSITLHHTLPYAGFCLTDKNRCGLVNLETGKQTEIWGSTFNFSENDNHIVTNSGIYDFEGQSVNKTSYNGNFYASQQAISEQHGVTFTNRFDFTNMKDQLIEMRNLDTGEIIHNISSNSNEVNKIGTFVGSNLYFMSGAYSNNKVFVLNLANMSLEEIPTDFPLSDMRFKHDWMVMVAPDLTIIQSTTIPNKSIVLKFSLTDFEIFPEYLIYSNNNNIYKMRFDTEEQQVLYEFDSPVHSIVILDSTGNKLIARLNGGKFALPHLNKTINPNYVSVGPDSVLVDKPSKTFFIGGLTDTSGKFNSAIPLIKQFTFEGDEVKAMEPDWSEDSSRYIARNGQLWTGSKSGDIIIRNIDSGLIVEHFQGHKGKISDLTQLDDNTMVSSSSDGTVKLWRLDAKEANLESVFQGALAEFITEISNRKTKLIATVITDKKGDYIITSADGYYWSTPKALHQASFLNGNEIFDYTQYDYWLNRPDIVSQRLNKASEESQTLWNKMVEIRQNRQSLLPDTLPQNQVAPTLSLVGPDEVFVDNNISVKWNATSESDADIDKLHILINEVPLYGISGLKVDETKGELTLPLTTGLNRIKSYITDSDGIRSESQFLTINRKPSDTKPNLYVLAVGVSDYEEDKLDLNYASKDAKDISALMKKSQRYNEVFVELITDKDVTRSSVLQAKSFLEKSRPDDRVIVFFAGHGFLDKDNNYYFGTTDIDPHEPGKNGLEYSGISQLLDNIPSRFKLLMLDTCHSGEVSQLSQIASYPNGVRARGVSLDEPTRPNANLNLSIEMLQNTFVDLRASTGAIVISASGGREYALENNLYKNGVFTSTILRGLSEKRADENNDNRVSTEELREFTYNEVSRLTNGSQKPTTRKHNLDISFDLF